MFESSGHDILTVLSFLILKVPVILDYIEYGLYAVRNRRIRPCHLDLLLRFSFLLGLELINIRIDRMAQGRGKPFDLLEVSVKLMHTIAHGLNITRLSSHGIREKAFQVQELNIRPEIPHKHFTYRCAFDRRGFKQLNCREVEVHAFVHHPHEELLLIGQYCGWNLRMLHSQPCCDRKHGVDHF
ncbi:hypothetical protein ES703_26377 [subsurface metagenome]